MRDKYFLNFLIVLLLLKSLFIFYFISEGIIGLGPDEAQYWTWSQALNWGYYSKPPGIAWQIFLGTNLFGNTELGIRFTALVIGFFISLAVYYLGKVCKYPAKSCFWAGVMMAFSPLGIMSSFLAITDGGLVLFWTVGCIVIAKGLAEKQPPNYYLLGAAIFLGALFKWPIYILWLFVLIVSYFYPSFRSKKIFVGLLISLLGLMPSLIWNMQHEWATFKHVFYTMKGAQQAEVGTTELAHGNFLDFLGAQVVLLSPVYFAFLVGSIWWMRKRKEPQSRFCAGVCFSLVGIYCVIACFQKLQGNWVDFAYPTGLVFAAGFAVERIKRHNFWLVLGTVVSIGMSVLSFGVPYVQAHGLWEDYFRVPYKINPYKHNVGWNRLQAGLKDAGYDPDKNFLVSDKYQTTSVLSFYAERQKRAYFLNLQGVRKNQFSYWPGLAEEQMGKDGYFVVVENKPHMQKVDVEGYKKKLESYFSFVEFKGVKPLFFAYGEEVKGAFIFYCKAYNGKEPENPEKY